MQIKHDFLQLSTDQIRQSILKIDESYNNDWDILAELIQNSVDAIRRTEKNTGEISITVDCYNKTISVKDNGEGIEFDNLPNLLCLFGTNKDNDEKTIGEKGVGLKFAMFSCNNFYVRSCYNGKAIEAFVKNAAHWKMGADRTLIPLEYDEIPSDFEGTEIILKDLPDLQIFSLTLQQLIFVLRTRTAVGNTLTIWDRDDIDISVTLLYKDGDGKDSINKIPFRYWLPIDGLTDEEKVSIDDYSSFIKSGDKTDLQKRLFLQNKVIYKIKVFDTPTRKIKSFSCFVPKWGTWEKISKAFNLTTDELLADNNWIENYHYTIFQAGIFTSIKGMPTGISIEHPITGAAGVWAQSFMLFEDRKLKFDIGRKSIHGNQRNVYKEYARELFNEYRGLMKYFSGDVDPETKPWDRDEIFNEIDSLIPLKSTLTKFLKTPRGQEGTVAAMFFEAIGTGLIKDITPLIAGYKNKYDLYSLWGKKRIVIEFKSQLHKIIKEFNNEQKLFNEINCIVCWDVGEQDQQICLDAGINLEKIQARGILNPQSEKFPHATHTMRYSGLITPIYVIDMKLILSS